MILENIVEQVRNDEALVDDHWFIDLKSPFSRQIPSLQLYWDSTSLGALKSCAKLYELSILRGYQSPYEAGSVMEFGIFVHRAREIYNKLTATSASHEKGVVEALRYAVLATWDNERKRPWTSSEPTRSRNTLLRTIVWLLDHYRDDDKPIYVGPDGKPAVELSFRFPLSTSEDDTQFRTQSTNEAYYLCGHIDDVRVWNTRLWIEDIKTTKYALDESYFSQFTPDNQVSLYDVAGGVVLETEVAGLFISACQILVNGTRFRRKEIPRSPESREDWLADLEMWLRQAEYYAIRKRWPKNEKSCGFGNRQCQFRPVCSLDPSVQDEFLETHYVKRPWNPLETR